MPPRRQHRVRVERVAACRATSTSAPRLVWPRSAARQPAAPAPITRTLADSVRCMRKGYAAERSPTPGRSGPADLSVRLRSEPVDLGAGQARGLVPRPDALRRPPPAPSGSSAGLPPSRSSSRLSVHDPRRAWRRPPRPRPDERHDDQPLAGPRSSTASCIPGTDPACSSAASGVRSTVWFGKAWRRKAAGSPRRAGPRRSGASGGRPAPPRSWRRPCGRARTVVARVARACAGFGGALRDHRSRG